MKKTKKIPAQIAAARKAGNRKAHVNRLLATPEGRERREDKSQERAEMKLVAEANMRL